MVLLESPFLVTSPELLTGAEHKERGFHDPTPTTMNNHPFPPIPHNYDPLPVTRCYKSVK